MSREIKTAVITGPTGAVGTALCRLLDREGITVYAVAREESARAERLKSIKNVQILRCDASRYAELPGMLDGVHADAFFHLAWAKTTGEGRNDMDAQLRNVQYALEACRAAARLGCRIFLGAGSQAEYGRCSQALRPETACFPENGYGMAKLCAGQMTRTECEKLKIDHVWPRILSVYGPGDGAGSMISTVIRTLLSGEKPRLTEGGQLWDFLCCADAARALFLIAKKGRSGAVYPIGSGKALLLREYIEIVRDCIDPALPLGFGEIAYGPRQVMHLEADLTPLKEDTGFEPATGFRDGIRRTIDWMKNNG